ncbi:MAG: DUF262 domain-containing protein, partial [Hyphomicrobium sp.]
MAASLQATAFTIGNLFSGQILLNIPVYQRPYDWGSDQAGQLLDDMAEAANIGGGAPSDAPYFLGTLLLMDSSGGPPAVISAKVSGREFDVVDGQQRLVTLVTLFAVLRDLEESP